MASSAAQTEWTFELVGGALCLDFANTVPTYLAPEAERRDHLPDYPALLSWARQTQIVDAATLARLARAAGRRPEAAERVVAEAHELRAAVYAAFSAQASEKRVDATTLATLSRFYATTHERQRLVRTPDGGYALDCQCAADEDVLEQILWPVVRSAVELLTSERRTRVRRCEAAADERCTWLFVDESKNHSRRWCSMRDCGNRAKVRRHYARQKREPGN